MRMISCGRAISFGLFLMLGLALSMKAAAQSAASYPRSCSATQLSLALDDEKGAFNGMSHAGALLVLRNLGPEPCSMPARPALAFEDAKRNPLPISLETAQDQPTILSPVVIPADAEATGRMHWVSSDAYGAGNCIAPAFLTLPIGKDTLRAPFRSRLCGPEGASPAYELTVLKRDPVYLPPGIGPALPAPVAAIVSLYRDQCLNLGGILPAGADIPRLMTADLDGDGHPDYVLNPQNLQCSSAQTAFCGNGGCTIKVALSGNGYTPALDLLGVQPTISQKEQGTDLAIWVSTSNCTPAAPGKACWAIHSWKDGKPTTRYEARTYSAE